MRRGQALQGGQAAPGGHQGVGGGEDEGGPGEAGGGDQLLLPGHHAGDDGMEGEAEEEEGEVGGDPGGQGDPGGGGQEGGQPGVGGEGDQGQGVEPQPQGGRPGVQPAGAGAVLGSSDEVEIVLDHGAELGHGHDDEGVAAAGVVHHGEHRGEQVGEGPDGVAVLAENCREPGHQLDQHEHRHGGEHRSPVAE